MIYRRYFKRLIDIVCSMIALVLLSPLFLIIGLIIKIESKGKTYFTQTRIGMNKKPFKIYKFRTMLRFEDSYYLDGRPIENYDRITKFGNFLRKTSLDELPQIINIFKGDMSLVGPRPTLLYQVEKYDKTQEKRLNVKPGLTGLAQVSGRNSLSWEEKIKCDLDYVNRLTFFRDIGIIFKTFLVVLKSEKVEFTNHDEISSHSNDVRKDVEG
ncbi:sugar transferase [Alkalibacillus salilacus]|uniref:Lipopolysaccharide/colanic/teichoic acid biosynthesis glycosyltransferase n=1 Tax=Alkalibacillus salilacus TaxID=284582 RepID=A0ABT9VHW6_9BACI|nr:sugar transferase [Alkalibacillus salilacus]MDQ0160552.1 lipopolysaccharide/colanic/teichoic acid biosynthesis glycosyltransferase [Alkalibacillus salilacus]